jgi:aspartate aminotransferase-like enzyme
MPGDPSILDVYVAGSQKALMLPPGLSVIALSGHAWQIVEKTPKRSLYFDLALERRALSGGETSWTPATTLIVGLNAAIEILRREGLDATYARHKLLSTMTSAGLRALGCTIMAPQAPCPSVTGFFAPEGIEADALRTQIRSSFGIRLAGGQGPFKGKVVRVGHMGYVDPFDVIAAISAIGSTLKRQGQRVDPGAAVVAALNEVEG